MLQQVEEDILKAAQMPSDKADLQAKLDALKVRLFSSMKFVFTCYYKNVTQRQLMRLFAVKLILR